MPVTKALVIRSRHAMRLSGARFVLEAGRAPVPEHPEIVALSALLNRMRRELIAYRRESGQLGCDLSGWMIEPTKAGFEEATFEAHHLVPLAQLVEGTKTRLKDAALYANYHRLIHRAIAIEKKWLGIEETRKY